MPRQSKPPKTETVQHKAPQPFVQIGTISNVGRDVNIGETITINYGLSTAEIEALFHQLNQKIKAKPHPVTIQNKVKKEVSQIESTITTAAREGKTVRTDFLAERFRNIARMAPDLLDVVVNTLKNPVLGMGVVVQKIAKKAKEEIAV